jgi:hypothetical protein
LCLVLNALALVLNVLAEKLGCLEVWWLGKAAVDGRTGQSGAPPDTVRCVSHITQPLGFDRWSSDMWGHRTVRWCTEQSLFTVRCAFWRYSDSARSVRAL